jgi:SAM-dependent methyltransferase
MRSGLDRALPGSRPADGVHWVDSLLRCPCELHNEVTIDRAAATVTCTLENCRLKGRIFPIIDDQPVLVDFDQSVLDEATTIERGAPTLVTRSSSWKHALSLLVFGDKPMARRNAVRFLEMVKARNAHDPVVLVVGGATIGDGAEPLYEEPGIRLIAFDLYRSEQTQFVADAHSIPLAAGTIDGVWIQAVLEHVLSPEKVVAEIYRVLKPGAWFTLRLPSCSRSTRGLTILRGSRKAAIAGCSAVLSASIPVSSGGRLLSCSGQSDMLSPACCAAARRQLRFAQRCLAALSR